MFVADSPIGRVASSLLQSNCLRASAALRYRVVGYQSINQHFLNDKRSFRISRRSKPRVGTACTGLETKLRFFRIGSLFSLDVSKVTSK